MQRHHSIVCRPCFALLLLAASVTAQTTLVEYALPGPLGEVGGSVADAGDVDGDGVHDLLVAGSSFLLTYSGADGSLLPGSFPVSGATGIGDLDGDGQRDIVAGDFVSLNAYSRATGGMIWAVENLSPSNGGGRNASVLPDINGDGVEDVAFGEALGVRVGDLARGPRSLERRAQHPFDEQQHEQRRAGQQPQQAQADEQPGEGACHGGAAHASRRPGRGPPAGPWARATSPRWAARANASRTARGRERWDSCARAGSGGSSRS